MIKFLQPKMIEIDGIVPEGWSVEIEKVFWDEKTWKCKLSFSDKETGNHNWIVRCGQSRGEALINACEVVNKCIAAGAM